MPIPTPGSPPYPANIDLPAGTDLQNRASFSTPLDQLADRTATLKGAIDPEFVYLTPTTRKRTIEATDAHASASGAGVLDWYLSLASGVPYLVPIVNAPFAVFPIDIPSGCTITAVEVLVRSSGLRVTPNGWFVRVYEQSEPWGAPAAATATQQGSTTEGGLAAGYSVITVGSLTPFIRVNEYTAHIVVTGPTGALGANDQLIAVRVSFDDGGPRNA
jgi:hypothetical protein